MRGRSRVAPATDEQMALAAPVETERRRDRTTESDEESESLQVAVPSPGGEAPRSGGLGDGAPGPPGTRRSGLMQRVRRASVNAIESVSSKIKSSSKILRWSPREDEQQTADCRFAPLGCTYTAHGEGQLANHYKQSRSEHTVLIHRALTRVEAENEALRSQLALRSEHIADAIAAVTAAEHASQSTNLAVKKLRRELREAAGIQTANEKVLGRPFDSRLQSLTCILPGQGELDTLVSKGQDAVSTLNSSADPYMRQRCTACGCIYTNFSNQIATCARHPGEKDVRGRWTCCQKAFTGLHSNGCVMSVHTAAKQLATSAAVGPNLTRGAAAELTVPVAALGPAPELIPKTGVARATHAGRQEKNAAEWLQSTRAKDAIRSVLPAT